MRLTVPTAAVAHYRVVIMGGGAGGCALSHLLAKHVKYGRMAVIEPSEDHFFQGGFTLVASGMKNMASCIRPNGLLINKSAVWLRNSVAELHPKRNSLILDNGQEVQYDFLVVAAGLQLRFDMIEGLPEAFQSEGVCSVYSPELAQKVNREVNFLRSGDAVYTFPNTPVKCAGAPQKICYLSDEIFRKNGVRGNINMMYNTSLGRIFGVEKYAKGLMKVIEKKNIKLNIRHNLIKVDPLRHNAVFEILDNDAKPTGKTVDFHYDLIHVGAPCSPVKALRECRDLTDEKGWLDVDPKLLVSTRFDNVFGVGDCLNTPNAKTAAAISSQLRALIVNIPAAMNGKLKRGMYDGYGSCPLLVSMNRVILAEFNEDGPLETLPVDQGKPLYFGYVIKRYILPVLYWDFLVKGWWLGPKPMRMMFHPWNTIKSWFVVPMKKLLHQ